MFARVFFYVSAFVSQLLFCYRCVESSRTRSITLLQDVSRGSGSGSPAPCCLVRYFSSSSCSARGWLWGIFVCVSEGPSPWPAPGPLLGTACTGGPWGHLRARARLGVGLAQKRTWEAPEFVYLFPSGLPLSVPRLHFYQ